MPERADDFTWQENKAFADIICEGMKQSDIEMFEFLADELMDGRGTE